MVRTLAVTAANEAFVPLLRGLIGSLNQWAASPVTDLACFDLGLAAASRDWVASETRHAVKPGWDLPVHQGTRKSRPELRGLTVRPYLRDYFPGYDVYLWLDADLWVQQKTALDVYIRGASAKGLAIAAQSHPAYLHQHGFVRQRVSHLESYYGPEGARLLGTRPYFNAGVFALRSSAPHWEAWARSFRTGLDRTGGRLVNDQTAINHAVWTCRLPVTALDARFNWCYHLAAPHYHGNRARFVEPVERGRTIGIVHLTAHTKREASLRFKSKPNRTWPRSTGKRRGP